MVHRIYPAELQLNKANASDTEAAFLDLNLSIIVSTKIYDKRDDFNFVIVNFPFLDGNVPQRPSYGVYILGMSSGVRISKRSNHVPKSEPNFSIRRFEYIKKMFKNVQFHLENILILSHNEVT